MKDAREKWVVSADGMSVYTDNGENSKCIVLPGAWMNNENEKRANALLIAAAPELLEACKEALAYYEQRGKPFLVVSEKLRKLIAKAEGKL